MTIPNNNKGCRDAVLDEDGRLRGYSSSQTLSLKGFKHG
ncbi:hypothetical protein CES85_2958 (plasmid) [Ochrobactrum quorumnocens]|uniref:Uncharacterized protein n=1 Tax=Ochrobactrum quorumnocens TaxID=271865 RepID=A0A248UMR1_9HYPH|nr:hypothetical protein CES85_2958 [[Ochrobactrum] quorumnocens]